MNAVAPLARPVFAWNHHAVIKNGGAGLACLLNTSLIVQGSG
jgi:hypothetical protein